MRPRQRKPPPQRLRGRREAAGKKNRDGRDGVVCRGKRAAARRDSLRLCRPPDPTRLPFRIRNHKRALRVGKTLPSRQPRRLRDGPPLAETIADAAPPPGAAQACLAKTRVWPARASRRDATSAAATLTAPRYPPRPCLPSAEPESRLSALAARRPSSPARATKKKEKKNTRRSGWQQPAASRSPAARKSPSQTGARVPADQRRRGPGWDGPYDGI